MAERPHNAWFAPIEGSDKRYDLDEVIYRCPDTGALLDVRHDLEALTQQPASEWRALFDRRWMRTEWPYGSGVWGKKEWVLPNLAPQDIVSFAEGGTPLLWANRYGKSIGLKDLWIKQCGNSHTGSFKDLGMTVLVSQVRSMVRRGKPVRAIACASTGDTSAALAAYCAAAHIPALVLLPRNKVSVAQLLQPLANGALVLSLDTDFDGCMRIVQELSADGTIYLANSINSLRIEGQKTISVELVQQFDWEVPDWVVVPGGNLGNCYALAKGFQMMQELGLIKRMPRMCVAQAERANPLYRAFIAGFENYEPIEAQSTAASAIQIGAPVSIQRAIRALEATNGVVEQANEQELANAAARADHSGIYACPHTGVALAAVEKLAKAGTIRPTDRVIVISTANSLKFVEFKRAYHESKLAGVNPTEANVPHELPAEVDAARRAIDEHLKHF